MKNYLVALPALLLAGFVFTQNTQAATNFSQRQLQRLGEMAAHPESSGNPYRIYIVDGFRDVEIDAFMNSNFNSIQNVMFTSVIITDKSGAPKRDTRTGRVLVEDDGC